MRNFMYAGAGAIMAVLLGAVVPPIELEPHAGTLEDPWPVYNSETVSLTWDATPYDDIGATIIAADIQLYGGPLGELIADFNARQGAVLRVGPEYRVHVRSLFVNQPNGPFSFQVRVYDTSGNQSPWSERVFVKKTWTDLPSPGCWLTI